MDYLSEYDVDSAKVIVDLKGKEPVRVLHVDDDVSFLKTAKPILEMQGAFQVDTVLSAEEAMEKLKKEKYDVVVSDYQMPGKNGLEFLKALRTNGNSVPFIMLTGKGREEVAVEAWNLGADHYVSKNGDPETVYYELAHCLRSAVRKHAAEVQARETVQKLEAIYRNAIEGIGYVSPEENFVYANKAFADILGCQENRLVGMNLRRFVDDEGWAKIKAETERRRQGEASRYELVFYRTDGTARNVMVSASPLSGSDGSFAGTVGIVLDITGRKKTEEELRRFSTAVRTSLDGIITGDLNGNIIDVNDAVLRMYGGTNKGDLLGKNVLDFLVESDRTRALQDSMESLRTGQGKTIEYRALTKNGTEIPIEITTAFMRDEQGEPIGFVDIVRNTAEIKKAELELQASEKKYRELADQLPVIVYEIDEKGRFTFVNQKGVEISGYSREDFVKGLNILQMVAVEHQNKAKANIQGTLNGEKIGYNEYKMVKKDGSTLPAVVCGNAIVREGKILGLRGVAVDITERKQAEEKLRESEEKFRSIFESANDYIICLDVSGTVCDVNERTIEAFGGAREELVGKKFTELDIFPSDMSALRDIFPKTLAGKGEKDMILQVRIRNKMGQQMWLECSQSVLRSNNEVTGLIVVARDITSRKSAEESLKESEERFRNLAEQSPNIIFINQKGKVVYANKMAEDAMGYKKEEYYSPDFKFLDLIAEESKESVKSAFNKHTRGEDLTPYDYRLVTKDGRKIDAMINSKLITYDGAPAILGVVTDVTDRKKAERMTLESQQKFRGLFMGNPEAAVYLGPDFCILDVNPRFEELFGYSLAEIRGKGINEVVVPNERTEEGQMLDQGAAKGYVYFDTIRKRKDGLLIPVSVSAAPIIVKGRPVGHVAMYKDISELKRTEAAMKEMMQKLATMNEKLRVVGSLTRHDVRNKLSVVTGNVFLAKKRLPDNPQVLDYLHDIGSACQQVLEIFDFARNYEMLGDEELKNVDVAETIEKAASLFTDLKDVKVSNDCRGLKVLADSLLIRLFYNLMDNSLKYGEKITQIRVYYEKSGEGQLKLVYQDDGNGISLDEKPNLFKEGYGKGTGYGLYLIKKMMEVYGWTIQETGEPGRGAQFTIIVPRRNQNGKENYQID